MLQESPEVGEMVYCSLVQMEGGGELLVAWGVFLDSEGGWWRPVGEVWDRVDF